MIRCPGRHPLILFILPLPLAASSSLLPPFVHLHRFRVKSHRPRQCPFFHRMCHYFVHFQNYHRYRTTMLNLDKNRLQLLNLFCLKLPDSIPCHLKHHLWQKSKIHNPQNFENCSNIATTLCLELLRAMTNTLIYINIYDDIKMPSECI